MAPPIRQDDGGYSLVCNGALSRCLERAEKICHDKGGYTVTAASDNQELLGHESGESQVEIRKSEATVYCGKVAPAPANERSFIELKRDPSSTGLVKPSTSIDSTTTTTSTTRACVPGATQSCVGPGGCAGGQTCASDGARFDSCDCGPATSPAPKP
jgi:hypothetical protein